MPLDPTSMLVGLDYPPPPHLHPALSVPYNKLMSSKKGSLTFLAVYAFQLGALILPSVVYISQYS